MNLNFWFSFGEWQAICNYILLIFNNHANEGPICEAHGVVTDDWFTARFHSERREFFAPDKRPALQPVGKSIDFQPAWFTWKLYKQGLVKFIDGPLIVTHELGKYRLIQSLERRPDAMQIGISPQPMVALIAGILILLVPRLLNYIVAIYLIIFGALGLLRWLAYESSIAENLSVQRK